VTADRSILGKAVIVTGAGGGIGRAHAHCLADAGARVVVNDVGGDVHGRGADASAAHAVVAEIVARGGSAIADTGDVSVPEDAETLVQSALHHFGRLDAVVNNAGILRDRMLANMSESEFDDVVRVHLKGHFAPMRHAAAYWRDQAKAGTPVNASVINTSSTSGLFGNVGQTNYGAAKTGIATLTIIAQMELDRYGVRCNAIAPSAITRLIMTVPGAEDRPPVSTDEWDPRDPANISPFVAYLATDACPINGRVFYVQGDEVHLFQPFVVVDSIKRGGDGGFWSIEELAEQAPKFQEREFDYGHPLAAALTQGLRHRNAPN
jgi:NAD(P)-dependent dehydrogenase (short-subunit alcohol dehydrogenase family)